MHVTFKQAQQALTAAVARAREIDTKMCIAVVDSGANLKAFLRGDDAWVGSIDIAVRKACTAAYLVCRPARSVPYRSQEDRFMGSDIPTGDS